jgi:hypothetical protein
MRVGLSIFLQLLVLTGFSQVDCNLELDKDSIKVYTCARPDSRYKTVRSSFTVNSSLSELAYALLDIDAYGKWQYKTLSAKILKKVSDREIVYYTEVEAPVLTNNRDFVIRLTIDPDPMTKGMIVEAVSIPEYLPPVDDVIRVPYSRARWTIVPAGNGKLTVDYSIDIDLGGSVPPWIVNMVAPKAPYETFKALRETIESYKGKKVSFLQ